MVLSFFIFSNPNKPHAMIPAGRINKRFGTGGGVMLTLYGAFPDEFDAARTPLFVTIDGLEVPLWCDRFERRGTSGATASFADFDTERRAGMLVGLEFSLAETASDDDAFYMEDLIGFAVEASEAGGGAVRRGTLSDYYDHEANPLFGITFEGEEEERLVPAVEEFILHIDFDARTLRMLLPEGLLEL